MIGRRRIGETGETEALPRTRSLAAAAAGKGTRRRTALTKRRRAAIATKLDISSMFAAPPGEERQPSVSRRRARGAAGIVDTPRQSAPPKTKYVIVAGRRGM